MTLSRPGTRGGLVWTLALWYAATTTVFALRPWDDYTRAALSDLSLTAAALGAGFACVARAFTEPDARTRSAWRMIGLAALSWGLGEVVTTVYELVLRQEVPFPSLADVGYLVTVPLFAAGLLSLAVSAHHLAVRLRAVLDGLLISSAVLLTSWVTVLGPVAHSSTDTLLSKVVLLAYPAGDVALVTLVAYVLLRSRAGGVRSRVPITLICVALGGFAVGDSGYAYLSLVDRYASGDIIDSGWLGGFSVLAIAALTLPGHRREAEENDARQLGILLPYLFVVASALVSSVVTVAPSDVVVTRWVRTSMILLMVVRQALTLLENSTLTRTLERRVEDRTAQLAASQERFRALVENSSDVVSVILPDGLITYQSDSSRKVFGHSSSQLVRTSFADLLDERSKLTLNEAIAGAIGMPERTMAVELLLKHEDGGWRQVETTVKNLLDEPSVEGLVLNTRDVSERRALEDQLVHEAFHDSLTGLANRALFIDRVSHALRRREPAGVVGVLFLDLDGFKEVNDSLGHASGDLLLREMARRLASCARPEDTIARLGGDEFAVLIESAASSDQLTAAAHRIRDSLVDPMLIGDRPFYVGASVGISSTDSTGSAVEDASIDAAQLIRNADLAMYRAKELKTGDPVFYDPAMHARLVDRLALEADLREAIARNGLHVHYQPTFGLDSGELVGVEALVRWTHPERGEIGPDDFIPLAEQTGLIHDLGMFVLREACAQGRLWSDQLPGSRLNVGVNLSGRQLSRAEFVDEVALVLRETRFPPEQLILEMTESVLMGDDDGSVSVLTALKKMGIRLAIDDFGTGYSSLSYLHRFPIDILKIDRSFVSRLSGADVDESLVQSIVQLGHTLQLETIAEGIEEYSQLLALRRLGCHQAQGFHFGRPGPAEAISALLQEAPAGGPPRPRQAADQAARR